MSPDELVELEVVDSISVDTVRRVQKKELKPWLKLMWCIPPKQDSEFIAAMEQVLTVYHRPALSDNCIMLGGQCHEAFGQLDDFSWERPRVGNRR